MVLQAAKSDPHSDRALNELCRIYWYPLYAYIRRLGHSPETAEDFTQAFFEMLVEKELLKSVDPAKGRFRNFILVCLKRLLADEADKLRAKKRGGDVVIFSIDSAEAAERYKMEPSHNETPDRLFDRVWARALMSQVVARLRTEWNGVNTTRNFDVVQGFLPGGEGNCTSIIEAAAEMGITEGAMRAQLHRLRVRYREVMIEELSRTVHHESEVESEMRDLFAALSAA